MSQQPYPGLPRAIGRFARRIVSDTITHTYLGFLFGLPALVVSVGISFYLPEVPTYLAGYVLVALLSIIVSVVSDSIDPSYESASLDDAELNPGQVRTLVVLLSVITVIWMSTIILVSGGLATIVQHSFRVGYIGAVLAALFPFVDQWIAQREKRFAVGHWAVQAGFEACNLYLAFRGSSNTGVDEEIEESAKKSGPII